MEPDLRGLLAAAVRRGDPGHAYIIAGPAGAERDALVTALAAACLCGQPEPPCGTCRDCRKVLAGIHPDLRRTGEEPVRVDLVRSLRADAWVRPNEAETKVYVLDRAGEMLLPAQNALLKLLEEGPAYAAFLLVTENELSLLATIRSRCQTVHLRAAAPRPPEPADLTRAETLADLLCGSDELALAAWCAENRQMSREALADLLDLTAAVLERRLRTDPRAVIPKMELLRRVRGACAFNVGVTHLLGWLTVGV